MQNVGSNVEALNVRYDARQGLKFRDVILALFACRFRFVLPTDNVDKHLETYLTGVFNFIGIEPEFVVADGLSVSPEQRESSISQALGETVRLAA